MVVGALTPSIERGVMIDQKAAKQERMWHILWFLRSHSNAESYDVWRSWASDSRRQRVVSDTIAKDLKHLTEQGYTTRVSDVQHGIRRYRFSLTSNGLRVCQEKAEGHNANL